MLNRQLYHGIMIVFSVAVLSWGLFSCSVFADDARGSDAFEGMTIGSIEVVGNVYISKSKILSMVKIRKGESFDVAAINQDVRKIATLKGVEYVYYNVEPLGGKLNVTFVVKEKNVVRQVVFEGDKKVSDKILAEQLGFSRGDYLDKFTAAAGAESLKEYYNKKGYPFATVDFDDSGVSQGKIIYNIESQTRVKIKKIYFRGAEMLKAKELRRVVKSKPKKFMLFQNYFNQQTVDDDTVKLQQAYDKRGYLDTKVAVETDFSPDNKKVEIIFNIIEGREYLVEDIVFAGNEHFDDANLADNFRLKKGEFYSDEKADFDREEVLKVYGQAGFVDVQVRNQRRFIGGNKIAAEFNIKEGQRFRIGRVDISGNKNVQDRVIRRVLDEDEFIPGRWYDAYAAKGSGQGELERRLRSEIYAESATITPVGDKPGQKDAQVRVTEGKTGSILFGAGLSSTDGAIGQIVYDQRNFDIKKWPKDWRKFFSDDQAFRGAGQRFRIALEPGTELSRYSVSFTEPYLKDKPTAMTLSGVSWERERENYDEDRQAGYLGFTKREKKGIYKTLAFRLENIGIDNLETDSPKEVTDIKGDNFLAGVKLGFGRDLTDSRMNPTKGVNYEMSYEQVSGDHTFGVLSGTYRWYKTLREDLARRKTILETKLFAGTIVGDAPLFEKFYAGGSGSIRGFDYRGISKRSGADDDPVGSDWIGTASAEIVIPMANENFAGLLFTDAAIIDTGGIRSSVGVGIQIMIPQWFGPVPMRFEIATPLIKDDDDETEVFSFSVGRLF